MIHYLGPVEANPVLEQAAQLFELDEFDEALSRVRLLRGEALPSSNRGRALALEVMCLVGLERAEEAQDLLEKVMGEEGDDFAFVLAAGVGFSDLDECEQAELFLRNLTELDPESTLAWLNLGVCLMRMAEYEEAREAFTQCLDLEPDLAWAMLHRANCATSLGDPEAAAEDYRNYLVLEKEDGVAWMFLGAVENQLGNAGASDKAFTQAARLSDDPIDVYFNWSLSAFARDDDSRVRDCLQHIDEIDAEDYRGLILRAELLAREGEIWPAWEQYESVLDLVLEDEREDAVDFVVSGMLVFVTRNGLEEKLDGIIDTIHSHELYSDLILQTLRLVTGEQLGSAADFHIVLGEPASAPVDYYVYEVCAATIQSAATLATEFHARRTGNEPSLVLAQPISEPEEGLSGVIWTSEPLDERPTESDLESM